MFSLTSEVWFTLIVTGILLDTALTPGISAQQAVLVNGRTALNSSIRNHHHP